MNEPLPSILHHKYSVEDGHVMAQIRNVEGYRGVLVTKSPKELRPGAPKAQVLQLEKLRSDPDLLKRLRVAGLHVHHGTLAPPFQFLKEKYGVPMFVGFRGNDATAYPKKDEEYRKALRKLFAVGDRFFPVCEHLKKEIVRLGCPEDRIRVLYGGVDLSRFEFRPRYVQDGKKIRFLAVGRFVEKKGFDDLIRAFAEVKKRREKAKLVLVGQGPCEAQYRRLISRLGLEGSVKIKGWVDYRGIQEMYYRSHVFCAPSVTDRDGNQEGIPNTLKEAMATGMPVVSTMHAGIPELVDSSKSGLLVPERSPAKLAEAMIWLAEHPERWKELGGNARKKVETDFNLSVQLRKQKAYYDEVVERRP
ncbi:colanic acid biosynthesis glycosyltransferase WcaL [Paenibacillus antri]|uniref:Colanic acid biosynthesis glycosyltransferase WcaL n=1 Tax=Paenibacillus antri TaxID=2582848 RepID=A0A5R9GCJ8_9BACL|nr:glycosyltransferase [Paenibacillus antri]TLS53471.1 colanic acid biosynthesis glycosyltransferase WcaL [Paenibacillus antri]